MPLLFGAFAFADLPTVKKNAPAGVQPCASIFACLAAFLIIPPAAVLLVSRAISALVINLTAV